MDPITLALVSALSAGLVSGLTKIGESVVGDAYNAIKTALVNRFGKNSKVSQAVKGLESNPKSRSAQETLARSLANKKAEQDQELLRLAQKLTQAVSQHAGDHAIQIGQGNTISGIVAQSFQGTVYNVNQAPPAPTAQDLLLRGVQLVRAGSYYEAIALLNQSVLATPSGDGNYYLALAHLQGKRPKVQTYSLATTIRQKLTTACQLDPGKGHYWYFLALLEDDFFIENGFSDNGDKVDDLLDTGDRCPFIRSFTVELMNHAPAADNSVYEYLRQKL